MTWQGHTLVKERKREEVTGLRRGKKEWARPTVEMGKAGRKKNGPTGKKRDGPEENKCGPKGKSRIKIIYEFQKID